MASVGTCCSSVQFMLLARPAARCLRDMSYGNCRILAMISNNLMRLAMETGLASIAGLCVCVSRTNGWFSLPSPKIISRPL